MLIPSSAFQPVTALLVSNNFLRIPSQYLGKKACHQPSCSFSPKKLFQLSLGTVNLFHQSQTHFTGCRMPPAPSAFISSSTNSQLNEEPPSCSCFSPQQSLSLIHI